MESVSEDAWKRSLTWCLRRQEKGLSANDNINLKCMYKYHICEWNTHFMTQTFKHKYLLQMHELCTQIPANLISSTFSSFCSNVTFSTRPGLTYYLKFCKWSPLPNSPAHFYSTCSFSTAFNVSQKAVCMIYSFIVFKASLQSFLLSPTQILQG